MTRTEHLLSILAEECNEVAQRAIKALRFGLEEIEPGQDLNNAERIAQEFADLLAAIEMLQVEDVLGYETRDQVDAKKLKVEKFLEYSRECGTLTGDEK